MIPSCPLVTHVCVIADKYNEIRRFVKLFSLLAKCMVVLYEQLAVTLLPSWNIAEIIFERIDKQAMIFMSTRKLEIAQNHNQTLK